MDQNFLKFSREADALNSYANGRAWAIGETPKPFPVLRAPRIGADMDFIRGASSLSLVPPMPGPLKTDSLCFSARDEARGIMDALSGRSPSLGFDESYRSGYYKVKISERLKQ